VTTLELPEAPPHPAAADDQPRRFARFTPADVAELGGSAAAGLGTAWLLVNRFGPFEGLFGFMLIAYIVFVAAYALVVGEAHGALALKDRLSTVGVTTAAVLMVLPLGFVLTYVVIKGIVAARHLNFFREDMASTGGADPLSQGGILHAVIGSLQQVAITLLICVPLAVATAVYLNEVRGRAARAIRFFVNAMSGIPSIVSGLFIYSALVLSYGFSGFHASLALSILMLPTVARTAEEVLRLVPGGLREAALALGAPEWRVVLRVVLPTARSGIITAVILGMARVMGEAAPVLLTAFGAGGTNTNPFSHNQESLPLTVYSMIRQPNDNQQTRAYGAALVLLALVLVLFLFARKVGARGPGQRGLISRIVRRK
jgi:phosphate transport system permease protein